MKMKQYGAALAAMLMLMTSAAACGSKSEEMNLTRDVDGAVSREAAPAGDSPLENREEGGAGAEIRMDDGYEGDAAVADAEAAMDAVGGAGDAEMGFGGVAEDAVKSVEADLAVGDAPAADAPIAEEPVAEEPPMVTPEIGVLTAGEWRDHDNWGFFSNLVDTGTISFPSFGLEPTHRVTVDIPGTANVRVTLLDADGAPVWEALTDKNGRAYLFETNGRTGVSVRAVRADGAEASAELPAVGDNEQGAAPLCSDRAVTIELAGDPVVYTSTQIMFIVDTTGSMGDEMLYLQSDFASIAEEVGDEGTQYAALFYKDDGDDYVTRGQSFTSDVGAIQSQLGAEYASGGGDEPEAVAQAFTEAFVSENWQEDAVKIAFLIYDAPPHAGTDAELTAAVEAAAAKGIHIVPIVSSNGSRETELFGRAAAIMTNGSYVFLTDDSGVGGSHLAPIIGDYEVEKLHDIVVRIIREYRQ